MKERAAYDWSGASQNWSMLSLATGSAQRACGLLFTDVNKDSLLLVPCNDIHTLGMRRSLDVAFVDRTGRVLEVHRGVVPFRRLKNKTASAVIERFASQGDWFEPGDRLGLARSSGEELLPLVNPIVPESVKRVSWLKG